MPFDRPAPVSSHMNNPLPSGRPSDDRRASSAHSLESLQASRDRDIMPYKPPRAITNIDFTQVPPSSM